jgi:hypothetical protein
MGLVESFAESQAALQASTTGIFGEEEKEVPDENKKKKKKGFDFLQLIFGWILDPITAIIDGIISIVKFVINSIKFCINLPWCFKWYIFYMIGTILYLPLALLFMFFGLQSIEKRIWKAKNELHDLIVCYTGYSIISYSDQIRDGCFFETIKKRKCPKAGIPINSGLSDILAEFMRGMFSFSYIGVVTALSVLFFFVWFFYYFAKPLMVRLYTFIMSYMKPKPEKGSESLNEKKDNASVNTTVTDLQKNISETTNILPLPTKIKKNKTPNYEIFNGLNASSIVPNVLLFQP